MKSKAWRWIIVAVIGLNVIAVCLLKYPRARGVAPVSEGDEIAAAETLLAEKLSGPRYFNARVSGINEVGGPWINVKDARPQVPQIAAARKLGPESVNEIKKLIDQMAEPHPSRMVGGERINLPRLNLSLDAMDPAK